MAAFHFSILYNPFAGSKEIGKVVLYLKKVFAKDTSITFVKLSNNQKSKSAPTRDAHTICLVLGGDGTINLALPHLIKPHTSLLALPFGTANDFCCDTHKNLHTFQNLSTTKKASFIENLIRRRDQYLCLDADQKLGISPPYQSAASLVDKKTLMINDHLGMTTAGLGLVAKIADETNYFKAQKKAQLLPQKLRKHLYSFFTVKALACSAYRTLTATYRIGKSKKLTNSPLILISNTPTLGKDFKIVRSAQCKHNAQWVSIFKHPKRSLFLKCVYKMFKGQYVTHDPYLIRKKIGSENFTLNLSQLKTPYKILMDGEIKTIKSPTLNISANAPLINLIALNMGRMDLIS